MKKFFLMFVIVFLISSCSSIINNIGNNYREINPNSTEEEIIHVAANIAPSERQLRWQKLEFTAFFHFGVNTFTNREWGDGTENPEVFNPTELDANQWVQVCKDAGIKQVIITAKHHDGFCLWPSKFTEHSVKNSPWKSGNGDVVKEVADACHKMGIGFGVYLSPWDRNNPNYGDSPKYDKFFINQLTELLTNYGKVDEVWFDGACGEGPNGKKQVYDWDAYYKCIRKLAPEAVIAISGPDVRWVGTESGYGRESEWSVVPSEAHGQKKIAESSQQAVNLIPKLDFMQQDLGSRSKIKDARAFVWYPAETDVSIRTGWFYHKSQDNAVRTPEKLLDIYFSSIGYNSVLLLNIPPDMRGLLHENDVKALKGFKELLDKMYATNFAEEAKISSDGKNATATVDNEITTFWTTKKGKESGYIIISLPQVHAVDVLCLQENICIGQRVEKFTLEFKDGEHWKEVAKGTTVGYKRLVRFTKVSAKDFRLKIEASRLNPTISEIGLYKLPEISY